MKALANFSARGCTVDEPDTLTFPESAAEEVMPGVPFDGVEEPLLQANKASSKIRNVAVIKANHLPLPFKSMSRNTRH